MKIINKLVDKLFIKQWNVGIAKNTFSSVLDIQIEKLDFKWLTINDLSILFADPFIYKKNDNYYIFYEKYNYFNDYGVIALTILNNNFDVIYESDLLDTQNHLSYPFIFNHNDELFILPESSKGNDGSQYMYEFNFSNNTLHNKKLLIEYNRLLDGTLLFHDNKYWLFSTKRGKKSNSDLLIHYSKTFDFGYISHSSNPVKVDNVGTRPAGNFIIENGVIYRPSQNNSFYYGKSIILNKIEILNESQFKEIPVKEIFAPQNCKYNFGIHTINISNDVIVIDGLRRIFNPFKKIIFFFIRKLFRK